MIATDEALRRIAAALAAAGIEEPRREARLLLAAALQTDAAGLLRVDAVDPAAYAAALARRAGREPLAYITGRREFWGLEFAVSPATLIPRPDSETLVEAALDTATPPRLVLDLGTGTGCLLLAVLHEFVNAFGVGVDINPEAAALARENARALGMAGRCAFFAGNWAEALTARFDLVLANPPYIAREDLAKLMPEILRFEPEAALDGGADGLTAYRAIISALPRLLGPGGRAVLELGAGQAISVARLAEQAGFAVRKRADLAGIDRALALSFCK